MGHMQLLSNFIFETMPSLAEHRTFDPTYSQRIISVALKTPYLMYEIMALSAVHLSRTRVSQARYYLNEAITLQTEALSLFNSSMGNKSIGTTAETDIPSAINDIRKIESAPMLLFANFLGIHALADTISRAKSDPNSSLNDFVSYLYLHRGVRSIIGQSWNSLLHSDISPILVDTQALLSNNSPKLDEEILEIFQRFNSLVDEADMDEASKIACRSAISLLQFVYRYAYPMRSEKNQKRPPGIIWAWPVMLPGLKPL
ncbi:uncharacterized protein PV09_08624 [Verruconis gallopava]|uniref:Uncharacterized protein n=1 Tax=Verruconis gallopava TaxID=253628 RepID=A0A0D1XC45_9PEZI|nr:uncharacterized protein PV09_08624 [Verruconis gallopava]KIV99820.1 hypothetical protein PV09_08624 [Verruconis gallopava]